MRPPQSQFAPGQVGRMMKAAAIAAASKYQQLSCAEGGQFDIKFWTDEQRAEAAREKEVR